MSTPEERERYKRYRERQKKRGFDRLYIYLRPEIKNRLADLAKSEGSYDKAIEKLLTTQEREKQQEQAA